MSLRSFFGKPYTNEHISGPNLRRRSISESSASSSTSDGGLIATAQADLFAAGPGAAGGALASSRVFNTIRYS